MNSQTSLNPAEQAASAAAGRAKALYSLALKTFGPVWLAAASLLFLGLWLQEHAAAARREAALKQEAKTAATEAGKLEAQAREAANQANVEDAKKIASLETEREQLAERAKSLEARAAELDRASAGRQQAIAALPPSALAAQLATRLGPAATAPAQPATSNGAAHEPQPGAPAAGLVLTEQGERQVESALTGLDACREQTSLETAQLGTCRQQIAATAAMVEQQKDSMAKLNEALKAQDAAAAERAAQCQAEVKAARGTWRERLFHTLEHVGVGVAIGLGLALR